MARLSINLPNFLGGVSNQPTALRLPNQVEDMDNLVPTYERGLVKRPGGEFVGKLTNTSTEIDVNDWAHWHFIDRGPTEQYLVVAQGNNAVENPVLRIYDLNNIVSGEIQEVTVRLDSAARAYLTNTTSETSLRFKTIGDVTFVTNNEFTPLMRSDVLAKDYDKSAIIYVRGTLGGQNEKVNVSIDGVSTGTISCSATQSDTQNLASQIYSALGGGDVGPLGTLTVDGHWVERAAGLSSLAVGDVVRFGVTSGTDYARWIRTVEGTNAYGASVFNNFRTNATPNYQFYVIEVSGNKFKVSQNPGSTTPVEWIDNGTNMTFTIKGTGSSAYPGFSFSRRDNVIFVKKDDGSDFNIFVSDGGGNSLVSVYKDTAQTFAELPTTCVDDFILKIEGDENTLRDNYYVRFKATAGGGGFGEGVWEETIEPGSEYTYGLYKTPSGTNRMPIVLIREADGSFTARAGTGRLGGLCAFDAANEYVTVTHGGGAQLFEDGDPVYFTDLDGSNTGTTFVDSVTVYYAKHIDNPSATSQRIELYTDSGLTAKFSFDTYWSSGYIWKDHFENLRWHDRQVGDAVSNPDPSFIGTPIQDIEFFNNRLAMITEDSVVLSEAGEPMNFFRTTVQSLLPSSPIDLSVTATDPSKLHHGAVVGSDLVLSSDRAQFAITTPPDGLTVETAQLRLLSNLEGDDIELVTLGRTMFIPKTQGNHTRVYEYAPILQQGNQSFYSYEVTEQCKRFVEGSPVIVGAMDNEGMLAVVTDTNPDKFYFYRTYSRGQERLQSAWTQATLSSGAITALGFLDYKLYYVVERWNSTTLRWVYEVNAMDFSEGLQDGNLDFPLHMDRKTTVTPGVASYDSVTDSTEIDSPFFFDRDVDANFLVVTADGKQLSVASVTSATQKLTVQGDYEGDTLFIGEPFDASVTLSEIVPRDREGRKVARNFRLTDMEVDYERTAFFEAQVTPFSGDTFSYPLDNPDPLVPGDPVGLQSGVKMVPVMSHAEQVTIQLVNNTPLPCRITSARVYGQLRVRRAGRL